MQIQLAANRAYVDRTASGFGADRAAEIVETDTATTTLGFDASGQTLGDDIAAFGFHLYQVRTVGNADDKITGELARTSTLPISGNPSGVALSPSIDFVGVELMAGRVFRRGISTIANRIRNVLVGTAGNTNGAQIDFDMNDLDGGHGACDFLGPIATFTVYLALLLCQGQSSQGRQQQRPGNA